MRLRYLVIGGAIVGVAYGCSGGSNHGGAHVADPMGNGGSGPIIGGGGVITHPTSGGASGIVFGDAGADCPRTTCAEIGWGCGSTVDACGNVINCADEGLVCAPDQICVGGINSPTRCQ